MMFLGRKKELDELIKAIESEKQENILIYGRRRIGKSELVRELILKTDVKSIYYQSKETTLEDNITSLSSVVSHSLNIKGLNFAKFEDILDYIFVNYKERIIFIIDEYPYLRQLHPGIDSVLQKYIDEYKNKSLVKIILLGSYIDVMLGMIESNKPLFGRITKKMLITEQNYMDASLFYPDISNEDKILYYSVFGGVPYYNSFIDASKSFYENIENIFLDNYSFLKDFVELFLLKEVRKLNNAQIVLQMIASNHKKFSDIQTSTGITSSGLSYVLETLISMDLIEKVFPINEPKNAKKTFYKIKDNFIAFHYRYIHPNSSLLTVMDKKTFYKDFIETDFLTKFVPEKFEDIGRQYLIENNLKNKYEPPFSKFGHYWHDSKTYNAEFDIVAENKLGYIFFEAKYTKKPVDDKVVQELISTLDKIGMSYHNLGFFSKSGFELNDPKTYFLISLEDIYK